MTPTTTAISRPAPPQIAARSRSRVSSEPPNSVPPTIRISGTAAFLSASAEKMTSADRCSRRSSGLDVDRLIVLGVLELRRVLLGPRQAGDPGAQLVGLLRAQQRDRVAS